MPITLAKLFSHTTTASFEFMGETVSVTWAPYRYTGEMQELSEKLIDENDEDRAAIKAMREEAEVAANEATALSETGETPDPEVVSALRAKAFQLFDEISTREVHLDGREKHTIRDHLSKLIVTWDVLDEHGKPLAHDVATLKQLPDPFLRACYLNLANENRPDPTNAPKSDAPSGTEETSAPSPTGSSSSSRPGRSASRRSSSTSARPEPATTRSGGVGRSRSSR